VDGAREWVWGAEDPSRLSIRLAMREGSVLVSKLGDPEGAILVFSTAEWLAFLGGARRGEFDLDDAGFADPRPGAGGLDDFDI
jgi:hypothetical protein